MKQLIWSPKPYPITPIWLTQKIWATGLIQDLNSRPVIRVWVLSVSVIVWWFYCLTNGKLRDIMYWEPVAKIDDWERYVNIPSFSYFAIMPELRLWYETTNDSIVNTKVLVNDTVAGWISDNELALKYQNEVNKL